MYAGIISEQRSKWKQPISLDHSSNSPTSPECSLSSGLDAWGGIQHLWLWLFLSHSPFPLRICSSFHFSDERCTASESHTSTYRSTMALCFLYHHFKVNGKNSGMELPYHVCNGRTVIRLRRQSGSTSLWPCLQDFCFMDEGEGVLSLLSPNGLTSGSVCYRMDGHLGLCFWFPVVIGFILWLLYYCAMRYWLFEKNPGLYNSPERWSEKIVQCFLHAPEDLCWKGRGLYKLPGCFWQVNVQVLWSCVLEDYHKVIL